MKLSPSLESGFLRLSFLRLLLPIGLLWGGGQGLYTSLSNRQPLSMTYEEYARQKPAGHWVELKETRLDLTDASYSGLAGSVSKVYVPLHAAHEPDKTKIQALLLTKDPAILDLVKKIKALPDDRAAMDFVIANHAQLYPQRTVKGLLQFGIESRDKTRRKLAKLNDNLASDFVVIDEGKQPEMIVPLLMFSAGLVAVWFFWLRPRNRLDATARDASSTPPPITGSGT